MGKSIAILGMGRYGQFLMHELCKMGADVLIADNDELVINQFADMVSDAIVADLHDPAAIKNIGLQAMDTVVVSMGSSLESSIMCVMVAKELNVPHVIAKAASTRMGDILTRVGADEIIYPEREIAAQTARKLMSENFLEYFHISDDLCVISLTPKKEWLGKSLGELRLRNRYEINVVAIRQPDGTVKAGIDPASPLTEEMELLVIANPNKLKRLED